MYDFLKKFYEGWKGMSLNSRTTIIMTLVGMAVAIIIVTAMMGRPNYKVLYANIDEASAAKITEELRASKIEYKLDNGGRTILVPESVVYQSRLNIAGKNMLTKGVGYEIFDKTNLGMTEFVQKVNYVRALEGELVRTIESLSEVNSVRVHLTIPEDKLFSEDQTKPKASVMLNLSGTLSPRAIEGILNLVAGSVDGLTPNNVVIVDNMGNYLGRGDSDDVWSLSNKQLSIKKEIEDYLIKKAQSMVVSVFGYGNAILKVDTQLDFSKIEKTMEQFDPKGQVIRSESSTGKDCTNADGSTVTDESSTTNYEISKTIEHLVNNNQGTIKKMMVSVILNGTYTRDDQGEVQYSPVPDEDLVKVRNIVANAVGFDAARGDLLSVENIAFRNQDMVPATRTSTVSYAAGNFLTAYAGKILTIIMLVVIFFIMYKSLKAIMQVMQVRVGEEAGRLRIEHSMNAVAEREAELKRLESEMANRPSRKDRIREEMLKNPLDEKELSPEEIEFMKKMDYVKKFSDENADSAASIIKSWLAEG